MKEVQDPSDSARKLRSRIFFIITSLISLICLAWTLHGANLGRLGPEIAHLDWRWVAIGMVLDVLVFSWQAWRWILVLKPVSPVPVWDCIRSIYVGLFVNEVVPLRAGEIIRCYLLGRWTDLPISLTLASALIERVFDGMWLVACLLLSLRIVHLPARLMVGVYFLGALVIVCGGLIGIAMFWKQQTLDYLLGATWLNWVHVWIEDLHLIGHSRYLYYAGIVSLPYILIQVLPIYALIRAYAPLHGVPLAAAFIVMLITRLGAVLPQAPGNVGTYIFFAAMGLQVFGVPVQIARRFSTILWAAVTIPLLVVGYVAVAVTGIKMGDLHKDAHAQMRKESTPAPITP